MLGGAPFEYRGDTWSASVPGLHDDAQAPRDVPPRLQNEGASGELLGRRSNGFVGLDLVECDALALDPDVAVGPARADVAEAVEHAGTFYPPDVIKSFEAGRKIQSTVKQSKLKVQASIQGEALRVSGAVRGTPSWSPWPTWRRC